MLRINRLRRFAALFAATVTFIATFTPAATADQSVRAQAGYTLTSLDPDAAGKCLDVYNWGQGPWIQMYPCHGGDNQDWSIVSDDGGATWMIVSHATGKVIDGHRGGYQQLEQSPMAGSSSQRWYLHKFTGGSIAFQNVAYSAYCMDIYDYGRGHVVQLWKCTYDENQRWYY